MGVLPSPRAPQAIGPPPPAGPTQAPPPEGGFGSRPGASWLELPTVPLQHPPHLANRLLRVGAPGLGRRVRDRGQRVEERLQRRNLRGVRSPGFQRVAPLAAREPRDVRVVAKTHPRSERLFGERRGLRGLIPGGECLRAREVTIQDLLD